MSDEAPETLGAKPTPALAPAPAPARAVRMELNLANLTTTYSNFFRVTGTFEEVMVDFGLHTGAITPAGPDPVKVSQRVVISFPTAKRLLAALQVAVARHEQLFGNIETDPQNRVKS